MIIKTQLSTLRRAKRMRQGYVFSSQHPKKSLTKIHVSYGYIFKIVITTDATVTLLIK
jgi:hypothetical protein